MKHRLTRTAAGACLLALALMLLTGCGQTSVFDGSRASDKHSFQMEYTVLNREESAELELSAGDQLLVSLAHTGGSVDVTVSQAGKEPVYRGKGQVSAEFSIEIPEDGVWRVSVTGHQAKGRVSFTRKPKAAE
ncbi:MAG: hypothetical protein IKP40_09760 [Clostridia bacterium]|nr:hypothetical protein [Clostridia bacterium]